MSSSHARRLTLANDELLAVDGELGRKLQEMNETTQEILRVNRVRQPSAARC